MVSIKRIAFGLVIPAALLVMLWPGSYESAQGQEKRAFTGKEDHSMSLQDAGALTRRFREGTTQGSVIGGFVGKEALQGVLGQPGCVGLRLYYAKQYDGAPTLVLVGVDAGGGDMVGRMVLERIIPCPPFCGDPNELTK